MNEKATVIIGAMGVMLVLLTAFFGVLVHSQASLVQAINDLGVCERDGMSECHIERDGVTYNVYGKGK